MGIKPRAGESPLSKLRVKVGMTQKQLAEKVGCSVSLIQKLEIGSRRLWSFKFLEKLFLVLELKAFYIMIMALESLTSLNCVRTW